MCEIVESFGGKYQRSWVFDLNVSFIYSGKNLISNRDLATYNFCTEFVDIKLAVIMKSILYFRNWRKVDFVSLLSLFDKWNSAILCHFCGFITLKSRVWSFHKTWVQLENNQIVLQLKGKTCLISHPPCFNLSDSFLPTPDGIASPQLQIFELT